MDAHDLLPRIDIWCQWDETFRLDAEELRQFFSAHPDTLSTLLLFFLEARGQQPAKKWLARWRQLSTVLPHHLMRSWLLGLARKKRWQSRRATEAETQAVLQRAASRTGYDVVREGNRVIAVLAPRANPSYAVGQLVWWRLQGEQWYQDLTNDEATLASNIGRGACWALADFPDLFVREQLTQMALKHVRAAVWALAQIDDDDALARLNYVTTRTADVQLLKKIRSFLDQLAAKRGLSREDLADQLVPSHELNERCERIWYAGENRITLAITPGGRVQRTIVGGEGKTRRNLPPGHEALWQSVLTEGQALSKTLSTQKKRVEEAMIAGRSWSVERWKQIFASHPILGHIAHRLVWRILDADLPHPLYALPARNGSWQAADGEEIQPSPQSVLSLAHPIEMAPEEHARWRHFIVKERIVQPFPQIFRETYVLTPAEEAARTSSARFAGHVIPYERAEGSMRHRGWLSENNGHGALLYWRDYPTRNVRAHLWGKAGQAGCILQQIAFYPLDHPLLIRRPDLTLDPSCLALREIHPVMFSEVMYDVDQYVVAGSMGTDENWQDEEDL